MKKTQGLYIAIGLIFIAVFNILFFTISHGSHPASVWIAFGFIHLAWLLFVLSPVLTQGKYDTVRTMPVYRITGVYFLIELVLGIVIILFHPQKPLASIIIQLVILLIFAGYLLSFLLTNQHTSSVIEERERNSADIRLSTETVRSLLDGTDDEQANEALRRCYHLLSAVPVSSNSDVQALDERIYGITRELNGLVADKRVKEVTSLCNELQRLIRQRSGN